MDDDVDDIEDVCTDCGARIDGAERTRAFPVTGDLVLCAACALRRGGAYDEVTDRWTVTPNLAGLAR